MMNNAYVLEWQTRIKEMNYKINRCQTQNVKLKHHKLEMPKKWCTAAQPIDFKPMKNKTHFMVL